jgi:hypothetical protein
MTEAKQADYLTQMLTGITARPPIKKFFWYQIWEDTTQTYGLLRKDESRKPAWQAYHDYTVAHPAPKTVSVNLSTIDIEDGVKRVDVGDGHTAQVAKASRSARQNANPAGGDLYIYFDVDDKFAFAGNRTAVSIDVDYYDLGTGSITLQYDSTAGGAYKTAGSVTLGNKDTWKQATFTLTDAYFGNRQNNGADFRLSAGAGNTFYLDLIQVNGAAVVAEPGRAWLPDATGDWQTPSNWSGGAIPNAVDAVATLGTNIIASRLVYTNTPVTLGTLNFNNANSYQIAGLGTLTMQASSGPAQINVAQGTHKINLPMTIASDTVVNVSGGGALVIADPLTVNAGENIEQDRRGARDVSVDGDGPRRRELCDPRNSASRRIGSGARCDGRCRGQSRDRKYGLRCDHVSNEHRHYQFLRRERLESRDDAWPDRPRERRARQVHILRRRGFERRGRPIGFQPLPRRLSVECEELERR